MLDLWFCIVFFGFIALCLIVVVIADIYTSYYNKQFAKKHPDYFELRNELIDKENECFDFEILINQKKKAIDEALDTLKYVTAENRTKIEAQIEIWRNELAEINEEARPHFEEHILLRDKMNKWHDELVASGELKEF